ncbi:unnamed protein product [Peronospora farinosa]|uniref:Uncharacterized protein n=1 Tax=Peronospora farinosa TaxID=134698 RepID=A0AAV0T6V8_9STRA|nr:unnamed protein product [Peronospora farinosa]
MEEALRRQFALVDASFCFVAKHYAAPTVHSILRVANSFGSLQLTRDDLIKLSAVAPELLILSRSDSILPIDDVYSPMPASNQNVEVVTFPLVPQTSQRASSKRKKLFDVALLQIPRNSHVGPEISWKPSVETDKTDFLTMRQSNDSGSSVLTMLQQMDLYRNQIIHVERRSSREAQYCGLEPLKLSLRVCKALDKCYQIKQLYSHQFEAIEAIRRGENVVLSTATASGKSLAYNIPMLDMLLEDSNATFMYLFPTKALAQDQLKALRRFLEAADLRPHLGATFDGDTPMKSRSMIIRETRVFLTNPDMLHLTILPKHRQWKQVLSNLRLLVVDEAHMYRGVFGSHVATQIHISDSCYHRFRLNLFIHHLFLQMTLPENIWTKILDHQTLHFFRQRSLKVITKDGAPSVEKLFCVWNPKVAGMKGSDDVQTDTSARHRRNSSRSTHLPKVFPCVATTRKRKRMKDRPSNAEPDDEAQKVGANVTNSAIFQGARILARLVEAEIATLLFCRGRKLTELVLMNVHSILKADPRTQKLLHRVSSYRGGYTLESRRRIEQRLFSGDLLGVVATNALELGIDIGELDCTIHLGLPSSIASLWQQAGRAGRRQQQSNPKLSVAIIVCFDAPLDQHFAQQQHAMELFKLEPEAATLNPLNRRILGQHLLCAARESALYSCQSGTAYIDSFILGSLNDSKGDESDNGGQTVMSEVDIVLQSLVKENKLMKCSELDGHMNYRIHSCMPKKFRAVSLRSICDENYVVVVPSNNAHNDGDDGEVLDEIPGDKAFFQVYPSAVYLHQAQEYVITRLDNVQRIAFAKKCQKPLTYFTSCRDFTDLEVVRVHSTSRIGHGYEKSRSDSVLVCVGTVSILTRVFGSTRVEKRTMRVVATNEFSLPPMQSFGEAVWLEFPAALRQQVEARSGASWTAALHGVGHLFVALVRLFLLCDTDDIDTEHVNEFEQRVKPNRVTIYERREGGSGLVAEIVKVFPKLLITVFVGKMVQLIEKSWTIASECLCTEGCPACIQSTGCSEYNHVLNKHGSLQVLEYLRTLSGAVKRRNHPTSCPPGAQYGPPIVHNETSESRRRRHRSWVDHESSSSSYNNSESISLLIANGNNSVSYSEKTTSNSDTCSPARLVKVTNALLYGVINSILTIPCMYGYVTIIFGHPDFTSFMPALSKLVMLSSVVHQIMFTLLSSLPFAIGQVQDAGLIFLSAIATSICNSLGQHVTLEAKVTTTVVTIGVATASLGVVLVLLGKFKLAGLVSYLPMPVVGGYLAFIGLFCMYAGLSLCTGLVINDFTSMMQIWDPHYMILCIPGVLGGVVLLLVAQRYENSFALPATILLMPILFFLVLAFCGISMDEARNYGWISPASDPAGFVQMFAMFDFSQMHWNQVPRQFTTWLGMTFVVAFSSCLDVAAIEMDMGTQLNINHELKSVGWSNVVSGLLGGYTGSYIFSQTIFTYRSKTNSRLVGVCVIISEFAIVLAPLSVMSLVPRFFFAATLIFIAIDLMMEWLVHVYHKILPREYVVLWLSFIAINMVSLELGMVLGVGFAIINFLLGYAQLRVVNRRSRSSAAVRKLAARTFLGQKRDAIVYLELYGYLFFGSSVQILEDVQKAVHIRKPRTVIKQKSSTRTRKESHAIDDSGIPLTPVSKRDVPIQCLDGSPAPHPDGLPTEYVVMDFSRVSGMDATAARSAFMTLQQHCKRHAITVIFADVLPEIRSLLLKNEIVDEKDFFLDAESALEFCENQLLTHTNHVQDFNHTHKSISVLLHRFMGEPDESPLFSGVDRFFQKYEVPAGYEFYRVASFPDRFYFLASGRVALFMNDDGSVAPGKSLTPLENVMPGAMFGEVDFFGRQYRYMAATAVEPCTVFEMTRQSYESMDELAPKLWNRLRDVVMQSMALSITNTTSINTLNNANGHLRGPN